MSLFKLLGSAAALAAANPEKAKAAFKFVKGVVKKKKKKTDD